MSIHSSSAHTPLGSHSTRTAEEERKGEEQNGSAASEQNSSASAVPITTTVTAPITVPNHIPSPPSPQARDPFLESILSSIKEIQKEQKDQQAMIISLLEDQKRQKDLSPPEWFQRWRGH